MKLSLPFISIMVCCLLAIPTAFTPVDSFLEQTQTRTLNGILTLKAHIADLDRAVEAHDHTGALRLFHKSRRTFKQHEFLLEYFHHSSINKKINGAPLPKIEEKVADLNVLPPQGFQRMEELLYTDQVDWAEMKWLVKHLSEELEPISMYQERIRLYDRHVIEAMRYELIRIYTLGVTGFENPGSDSSLQECYYAFEALERPTMHYAQKAGAHYARRAEAVIADGKKHLHQADFDTFDRLEFLKTVVDPLFALLYDIHTHLGIETHDEVNTAPVATNYAAKSLFDINLLNKDYFLKYRIEDLSEEQYALGKMLFYDPALSYNNSLSCSSCHDPSKAFTDGRPKSLSNDPSETLDRNAPTLVNALFSGAYFHDLRAGKLDMQTEHVMASPKEFNIPSTELAEKLKQSKGYVQLFQEAYPGSKDPIQPKMIKRSLAAYVSTLVSWDSPFDKYVRGESDALSEAAKNGYNLFMGKATCGTCHFAPNFSGIVPPFYDDTESEVLGVTASNDTLNPVLDADEGRFANGIRAEHAEHFRFSFKTPTIRNIELTAPYFHNGSYPTLEEVMWFYNQGGGQGIGLDVPNQTLPPDELGLTQAEIADVVAFMKSLTDIEAFVGDAPLLPAFEGVAELQGR
ncbi:MAG: c-type cytochrome [Flavobacteriales bacterium]|nr:c-type cytochrome [Flavobacteriales bacterium]